jgi:xylulokinase
VIVGVDIGTQSAKAVVVDEAMRVLGEAAAGYPVCYPRPGWAEQDPHEWEKALGIAIARALAAAGVAPAAVQALGIAGQLDGCVPVAADGAPLGPCLLWSDRRAVAEVAGIDAVWLRQKTGVNLDASHMAAKIRWLERAGPGRAARYHQPVSYVVERLTGEVVFDPGLASTTMLYDLAAADYDEELLARFAVSRGALPRIAPAADRAGTLHGAGAVATGLPVGTPVAVGTGDDFAAPLGAGLVTPGRAVSVIGTAEVVGALAAASVVDPRGLVETHAYPGGLCFIENPGWLAGGAVEWFCRSFRVADAAELDARAEAAPAGAAGVTFLPALSGAMAPEWVASARGCFYGLSAAHDVGHMARALLEGCAFAMRDVLCRLRELSVAVDELLLLGGGARSRLWARIRADSAGFAVRVPARVDTTPVGAAMLAAVAAGLAPTLAACAARLVDDTDEVLPDARTAPAYDAAYERYLRLFDSLRPLF